MILKEQGHGVSGGPRQDHLAALTGLRAFAALVVVVVHGSGQTDYPEIGIHGFGPIALFVLSGYLLITPWSRWSLGRGSRPNLVSFARRRVMRIFPAYLVVLVVVALIYPASRPIDGKGWLLAATLTNVADAQGLRPAMEHIWSLCTELSWYLALPAIGAVLAILGRHVLPARPLVTIGLVLALAAAVTIGWVVWNFTGVTDLKGQLTYPMWLPAFIVVFIVGATIRHVELSLGDGRSRRRSEGIPRWVKDSIVIILVLASVGIIASDLSGPKQFQPLSLQEHALRSTSNVILAATLLAGVVFHPDGLAARVLRTAPLVALGRWSYGIYLWHLPVTILLAEHMTVPDGPAGFVTWIGLLIAISAALGAITYGVIEKPAIAWSKRSRASA